MDPGSTSHHIFSLTHLLRCTFCLQISLCNQSWRDWQPLYSVGCKLFVFVQVLWTWRDSPTGLIPWFSNWGKYLLLLCCITLSSSRENQRKLKRRQKVSVDIAEGFLASLPGRIMSRTHRSKCRKLISCIYLFCLSFSSPPLLKNKNLQKYICLFHLPFFLACFLFACVG